MQHPWRSPLVMLKDWDSLLPIFTCAVLPQRFCSALIKVLLILDSPKIS